MQALDRLNPSPNQRKFFEQYILDAESTILTLKSVNEDYRGFSVNVRGPFTFVEYKFPKHSEIVIDATWAGKPESKSHLHCCWSEVRFAKLASTNGAVKEHIGYRWQVSFFACKEDAEKGDRSLFWFYLKDDNHKAVKLLRNQVGKVLAVA